MLPPLTDSVGANRAAPNYSIERICANCTEFDRGLCRLRARADWGQDSFVKPTRKACYFAELHPF